MPSLFRSRRASFLAVLAVTATIAFLLFPPALRFIARFRAERLLERELPPVMSPPEHSGSGSGVSVPSSPEHLSEVNLPVPFTVQAPRGDWSLPYQEACEEASVLMALRYAFGNPILSPADADAGILDLVAANADILHYPMDQTASQVRDLILEVDPKVRVRLLEDPGIEQLQAELSAGNVIIVPAAGRLLKNPFFRSPGPRYHMLVLRGYTEDGYFITNDPGTKRGEGYLYPFERIMAAMHDWPGGNPEDEVDVTEGRQVVLVVEPMEGMER